MRLQISRQHPVTKYLGIQELSEEETNDYTSSEFTPIKMSQQRGLIGPPELTYDGPTEFRSRNQLRPVLIHSHRQYPSDDSHCNGCVLESIFVDGESVPFDDVFVMGTGSVFDNMFGRYQNILANAVFNDDGTTTYRFY